MANQYKLPTKEIEAATVYYAGEYSAGIRSSLFDLEVYIDLDCFSDDEDKRNHLESCRAKILALYEEMIGDKPSWVMFDFELREQNRLDYESANIQKMVDKAEEKSQDEQIRIERFVNALAGR